MGTELSSTDFRQKTDSPDTLFIRSTRGKYFGRVFLITNLII